FLKAAGDAQGLVAVENDGGPRERLLRRLADSPIVRAARDRAARRDVGRGAERPQVLGPYLGRAGAARVVGEPEPVDPGDHMVGDHFHDPPPWLATLRRSVL